jgi:hypothetical protein
VNISDRRDSPPLSGEFQRSPRVHPVDFNVPDSSIMKHNPISAHDHIAFRRLPVYSELLIFYHRLVTSLPYLSWAQVCGQTGGRTLWKKPGGCTLLSVEKNNPKKILGST